jgi:hypothetical protein
VIEVLVGDASTVEALCSKRERGWRNETVLVRADPRVDDEVVSPMSSRKPAWPSHVTADVIRPILRSLALPCDRSRNSAATISISSSTEVSSVRLSRMIRPLRSRFTRSHISSTCT